MSLRYFLFYYLYNLNKSDLYVYYRQQKLTGPANNENWEGCILHHNHFRYHCMQEMILMMLAGHMSNYMGITLDSQSKSLYLDVSVTCLAMRTLLRRAIEINRGVV